MLRIGLFCVLILLVCDVCISQGDRDVPADLSYLYNFVLATHPDIKSSELQLKCAVADRQTARGRFDLQLISDLSYTFDQNGLFSIDPRADLIGGTLNAHGLIASSGIAKSFRSGFLS